MTESVLKRIAVSSAALVVACSVSGCASWRGASPASIAKKVDLPDGVPWKSSKTRRGVPRKMVVTWTDAVKHQPGKAPQRGVGGRVYFYDSDETAPIGVDGELVVYAFNEQDRLPTENRPDKRYVFPAEQFKLHESESKLGVSYSVWLPWDSDGVDHTELSLIPRFQPTEGGALIVGEQTRQLLPGKLTHSAPDVMIAKNKLGVPAGSHPDPAPSRVRAASYQSEMGQQQSAAGAIGIESTTIKMPSGGRRR